MNSIAIYSGSFDPIHNGHVEFALQTLEAYADNVVFLPEKFPRTKSPTALADRLNMLSIAVKDHSNIVIDQLDEDTFTVTKSLPLLQQKYGHDLIFMFGSDVVRTFSYRWPDINMFLSSVKLLISLRGHDSAKQISDLLDELSKTVSVNIDYQIIHSPKKHLTSTSVRVGKHTINDLDQGVADYIKSKKLYAN